MTSSPSYPLAYHSHIDIMHIFPKPTIRFVTMPVPRATMAQITGSIITVSVLAWCHPRHPQQRIAPRSCEDFFVAEVAYWPITVGKIVIKAKFLLHSQETLAKLFIVLYGFVNTLTVFVELYHLKLFWTSGRNIVDDPISIYSDIIAKQSAWFLSSCKSYCI